MLEGQNIGLGLNLGVAASEFLIPADAVRWLRETLTSAPTEVEDTIVEVTAPTGLPERLILGLDEKLVQGAGFATCAFLAASAYRSGRRGHVLAFVDTQAGLEDALVRSVNEALIFSGLDAGELDILFVKSSDPIAASLARVALRFDLPEVEAPILPGAPGMDPDKPPKIT